MISKSFEESKSSTDSEKQNKTFEFQKFYKPDGRTSVSLVEKHAPDNGSCKENFISNKLQTPKMKIKPHGRVDISKININGDSLSQPGGSFFDDSKVTSTPNAVPIGAASEVKSIMKNKSHIDTSLNVTNVSISSKAKKRNKSVSFMLDDAEGVAIKRTKSEETISKSDEIVRKSKKYKKSKKKLVDEKENKSVACNIENVPTENVATTSKLCINSNIKPSQNLQTDKTEKINRHKMKRAKNTYTESDTSEVTKNENEAPKFKRVKKKKCHIKSVCTDSAETDGEPAQKTSKKEVIPEKIAQDMENLNIGDNTHTLTNLLDEMTVVDKNKKNKKNNKRNKVKKNNTFIIVNNKNGEEGNVQKKGKDKKQTKDKPITNNVPGQSTSSNEDHDSGEKEKIKWARRKWNKDKKAEANVDKHLTSIIVENLPLSLMFTYKKLLTEHFEKCGMIRQVGIIEAYPSEDPKPVFTTRIYFYSEDAAEKALEEDNTVVGGARVRVSRPLAPALTTAVVRSYGALTTPTLSALFAAAGRIRTIRHIVKGKKSLATAFIEFDGPESVERAIQMAENANIGGKKIYAAKFEIRASNKTKQNKSQNEAEDSDNSDEKF